MKNTLTKIAKDLLIINEDIDCRFCDNYTNKVTVDDFELYIFSQTWGDTTIGFGGIGGQSMTEAMTYVFIPKHTYNKKCYVYFNSIFAYSVDYSENFYKDIQNQHMLPVYQSYKYK